MEEKLKEQIKKAEQAEELPPDKFDHHMRKARRDDIESRRRIFIAQSEDGKEREAITPSVY